MLAYSPNTEVDDPIWNELVTQGYCSYNAISTFKNEKIIENLVKSKAPYILEQGVGEKIRRICAKITINQKIAGYYTVLEYNKPFEDSDIELASLICDAISSEMQKYSNLSDIKDPAFENFIIDLLDNKITSADVVAERCKSLDRQMAGKYYLLSINIDNYDHTRSLIPYMRDYLEKIISGARAVAYHNHIIVIIGYDGEKLFNKENLQNLIEFLRKNKMRAGLSQCFDDFFNLRKYYKQSVECLKVGYKVNKRETFYMYDDYAMHIMINICSKHQDITDFCHPALLNLIEYDKKHKTNYVGSLLAYINHAKNLISAADALFIHRNTMSYRIGKIQKIAGIDFNNDNLLMQIFLSYKILNLKGTFSF